MATYDTEPSITRNALTRVSALARTAGRRLSGSCAAILCALLLAFGVQAEAQPTEETEARSQAEAELDADLPIERGATSTLEPVPESMLSPAEEPLFSIDSPIGPLEYGLGRGLRIGNTGIHVGGFTTVEFDRENGKAGDLELDSINFLVLFEPNQYIRGFAELEVGDLFAWRTDENSPHTNHEFEVERLYGDLIIGDPFALRGGKFLTPIGRWNLVPAEPFVWTPIEPAFLETAFDEHLTGGAILGSFFPAGGTLDYWIFGQFVDPLDPSEDPVPSDHTIGGRLQYGRTFDHWSVGSSFMATEIDGDWSYLGGLDTEFRIDRLLVTSEFTIQEGSIEDRDLWDVYVQGVFEVVPTFNLVARFEHLDPKGSKEDANLADLGVAWIPKPYLHFRASYRVTDQQTEEVRRGLSMSFSFIF